MSLWDDSDEPRITIADMARALRGEDREAFLGLMSKAVVEIEDESQGMLAQYRSEVESLRGSVSHQKGRIASLEKALTGAKATIAERDKTIANMLRTVGSSDVEVAQKLAKEVDFYKQRVEIQRRIIAGHERTLRNAGWAPLNWSLGKALAAFVSPITGAVTVR